MPKMSPSPLGRLLEEISWEGNARHYREGGRGFENVLTVEVFQALDFLPRARFLGRIVESLAGGGSQAAKLLSQEAELVTFSLLPGDIFLSGRGTAQLAVQPDGIIESPSVYCLLEAKRIKRGAFQPEQLAREYLAVMQKAGSRLPLLLLVLPTPPPIPIRGYGRMEIHEAVSKWIEPVVSRCEHEVPLLDTLRQNVNAAIGYITWSTVASIIGESSEGFARDDPSVDASVSRVAHAALQAIEWHS